MFDVLVIGGLILDCSADKGVLSFLRELDQNCRFHFMDLNAYSHLEELNKQLSNIINILKTKLLIVGYSTGALVALKYILQKPTNDQIYFVAINSTVRFMEKANWRGISLQNFDKLYYKLQLLPVNQFAKYFINMALHPHIKKDIIEIEVLQSKYCNKENIECWLDFIKQTDLREELKNINFPSLFLLSDTDCLVDKHNNICVNQYINQFLINNSSHAQLNNLEILNCIKQFIKSLQIQINN